MARCVWALESKEIVEHLSEMQEENSRGWLVNLIETMPYADLIRGLVPVWAIWYARRKAIHENIFQSLLSTHSDGAILLGFPKVHDSPIQGRISKDHTKTPTRA
jgi:hypothetical protein